MRVIGPGVSTATELLSRYGLSLERVSSAMEIPGSYWGDSEAGLVGSTLYLRQDTPLHSLLHEACHFICMDDRRRAALDTDAGGDDLEESAVCYLSILLADELCGFGRRRMLADMDAWGYSFRLGCTQAWFEADAEDAVAWLECHGLVDAGARPTWRLRTT